MCERRSLWLGDGLVSLLSLVTVVCLVMVAFVGVGILVVHPVLEAVLEELLQPLKWVDEIRRTEAPRGTLSHWVVVENGKNRSRRKSLPRDRPGTREYRRRPNRK